jgi:uncharacterized membrane protein YGL010W
VDAAARCGVTAASPSEIAMRKVDELFERYGESHRNRANEAIHWICVPLITWSIVAALWVASPVAAYVGVGLALAFYLWLSPAIAIGMLALSALIIWSLTLLGGNTLIVAATMFVLAWVGQLIGHAIEGKKPSFFEDVKFLLIGPAWLLHFIYRGAGIRY